MRHRRPYFKQKLSLLFDADFPIDIMGNLKKVRSWRKHFNFKSVHELGRSKQEDEFHFNYCKKEGYIFVTLDSDFVNDRKHPFSGIPGMIYISGTSNNVSRIEESLDNILYFLKWVDFARLFMGDTKIQVNLDGFIVKGRNTKSLALRKVSVKYEEGPSKMFRKISNTFDFPIFM